MAAALCSHASSASSLSSGGDGRALDDLEDAVDSILLQLLRRELAKLAVLKAHLVLLLHQVVSKNSAREPRFVFLADVEEQRNDRAVMLSHDVTWNVMERWSRWSGPPHARVLR